MINEIIHKDTILARHITSDSIEDGLSFFSKDNEFVQVGTWNYNANKELLKHIHNVVPRTINRTQEVLYIIKGSVTADIYSLEEEFVTQLIAKEGDILILLNSGHGYKILEDETKVLEVKNGPYLGAETDRRRF